MGNFEENKKGNDDKEKELLKKQISDFKKNINI